MQSLIRGMPHLITTLAQPYPLPSSPVCLCIASHRDVPQRLCTRCPITSPNPPNPRLRVDFPIWVLLRASVHKSAAVIVAIMSVAL
jgi:hypothetical protein